MDWFGGRVSLGNLDLAGAVNKLQESVKNIEKNFDSALGLESQSQSQSSSEDAGSWSSSTNRKALFDPVAGFMGHKGEEETVDTKGKESTSEEKGVEIKSAEPQQAETVQDPPSVGEEKDDAADRSADSVIQQNALPEGAIHEDDEEKRDADSSIAEGTIIIAQDAEKMGSDSHPLSTSSPGSGVDYAETVDAANKLKEEEKSDRGSFEKSVSDEASAEEDVPDQLQSDSVTPDESNDVVETHNDIEEEKSEEKQALDRRSLAIAETSGGSQDEVQAEPSRPSSVGESELPGDPSIPHLPTELPLDVDMDMARDQEDHQENNLVVQAADVEQTKSLNEVELKENRLSSASNASESADAGVELEKVKREMKMMEAALQGAARQAQAKADEIAKLMNENEQLKTVVEDLRKKSSDAEIESLREEYHQRVATLERKVYALTKERDTLRREQSKRSDAAALLKEKDEIINQVMAEGEELSKKQAAQEAQMRRLRAQIRELEDEKKGLLTKLQLEENKVESIKKDKAATEKLLQETIEKHQAELAGQKEYYTNALNAAKEAEALAEARANNEARTELEGRLREAEEREAMLVQALEELRQTLSRQEQQAGFREDMLRRDIEDLQKRYQASERRCEELITQVPESTRPLLRQIEAMQETTSRRAEAWAAVERSLNSRLQEAEAKAAEAEERERSINERLSQTLSRINVLEAQISCLRAEQAQLNRSLEKERQRAAENRQEYLAAKEEADTHEGHANQLEEELKELKRKHKQELQEALAHRELLEQELEREKTARSELERTAHVQSSLPDHSPAIKQKSSAENGKLMRKLSSASSVGNMEESFFLQASLNASDNLLERRNSGEAGMNPYYLKSMTPSAFEAALRQKEGELSSYMTRLASMESIRDSLAEELVKMTEQCEKLRAEAAVLPGIRAELEALRRRHSAALELMGERDEELEELRADIVDLKEMYREQVNLLVNKIQNIS